MDRYLIYGLYCPIRQKPVYIGKSSSSVKRPFDHIAEKSHSKKVNEWIRNLKSDGLSPVLVILESTDNQSILEEKETFWIHKFISEGNPLLNQQKINPIIFDILPYSENNNETGMDEVSVFVKIRRKQLKMTQIEFAKKIGVALTVVRKIEQGKTNLNTMCILRILQAFGSELSVVSTRNK